jgi:enolase
MTRHIESVRAMEILDSRGNPTIRVFVLLTMAQHRLHLCHREFL